MQWTETVFYSLEILGTISFAISGAMAAIRKKTDFFGVLFLGVITAVGGGISRDLLLGKTPPTAFTQWQYVLAALAAAAVLFAIAYRHQEQYRQKQMLVDTVNNIFDAIGLGIFSSVGVQAVWEAGQGENLFLCLFLGMVTGIGGGLLRDLMLQEIPFVLTKRIYAVAALLGALCEWFMMKSLPTHRSVGMTLSIALVFLVRMLATKYHWDLPKAME